MRNFLTSPANNQVPNNDPVSWGSLNINCQCNKTLHPSQKWIWKSNSNISRNVSSCYNSCCCLICLQKENKSIEGKSTERRWEEKQELWEDEAESRKNGCKGTESIEERKRKDDEQPRWSICHATPVYTLCVEWLLLVLPPPSSLSLSLICNSLWVLACSMILFHSSYFTLFFPVTNFHNF